MLGNIVNEVLKLFELRILKAGSCNSDRFADFGVNCGRSILGSFEQFAKVDDLVSPLTPSTIVFQLRSKLE